MLRNSSADACHPTRSELTDDPAYIQIALDRGTRDLKLFDKDFHLNNLSVPKQSVNLVETPAAVQ